MEVRNVLFNNTLNIGVGHSGIGNPLLHFCGLLFSTNGNIFLYAPSLRQHSIYHDRCYTGWKENDCTNADRGSKRLRYRERERERERQRETHTEKERQG